MPSLRNGNDFVRANRKSFRTANKPAKTKVKFLVETECDSFYRFVRNSCLYHLSNQKGDTKKRKKMEDILHPHHPWVTLQTKAANKILEDCSNNVVGLQRIVKSYVDYSGTPSNWWGFATVEFINKVGGIEREERWYVFDPIQNEDTGKIMDVVAHEDIEHWGADKGYADDQYKMGIRCLEGHHAWTNTYTARDYFLKAAAQGNKNAAAEL